MDFVTYQKAVISFNSSIDAIKTTNYEAQLVLGLIEKLSFLSAYHHDSTVDFRDILGDILAYMALTHVCFYSTETDYPKVLEVVSNGTIESDIINLLQVVANQFKWYFRQHVSLDINILDNIYTLVHKSSEYFGLQVEDIMQYNLNKLAALDSTCDLYYYTLARKEDRLTFS